jgi:hypothetical protein
MHLQIVIFVAMIVCDDFARLAAYYRNLTALAENTAYTNTKSQDNEESGWEIKQVGRPYVFHKKTKQHNHLQSTLVGQHFV